MSRDDQDRFGPATYGYAENTAPREPHYGDSDTAERRYGSFDSPPDRRFPGHDQRDPRFPGHDQGDPRFPGRDPGDPGDPGDPRFPSRDPGESSRDLGARLRDLGLASRGPASAPTPAPAPPAGNYPPHPFAATPPPPVPSQRPPTPDPAQTTRRIHAEQHRAPAEPSAAERATAPQQRGGIPTPMSKPVPLQVERPEDTELAARRLAALLRDDPTLLNQSPPD